MKTLLLILGGLFVPLTAVAQELGPIPQEAAREIAKDLLKETAKFKDPAVKIEPHAEGATGVHIPQKLGLLVIPQRGLRESAEYAAQFQGDPGAPLGYLLMYKVVPIVNDRRVDPSQLHSIKITDDSGNERTVHALLLAIRQLSDSDYRLYGYGSGKEPVVDAQFAQEAEGDAGPVAIELLNLDHTTRQGDVAIKVFGKYVARFRAAASD